MKASKKLILVSAATIMLTVPVLANNHLSNPVAAASQDNTQTTKLTFYINHNAYVYNHQGKRTKSKIKKGKLLKVTHWGLRQLLTQIKAGISSIMY